MQDRKKDKRSGLSANDDGARKESELLNFDQSYFMHKCALHDIQMAQQVKARTIAVLVYLVVGGLAGTTGLAAVRGGTEE